MYIMYMRKLQESIVFRILSRIRYSQFLKERREAYSCLEKILDEFYGKRKHWIFTGDTRGNQNPQLTILQIMFLREHNRIADYLTKLNPHWNDETTFQETRRIVIAEHQYISYYEWLPIILGMHRY
jgi:hypothetical protein